MIKEAIEKLISLGTITEKEINGRMYAIGAGGMVPIKPPKAETLTINTLTGIVDYAPTKDTMLHVVDHKRVDLIDAGFCDGWLIRSIFLQAVHESPVFNFGQYYDVENLWVMESRNVGMAYRVQGGVEERMTEGVSKMDFKQFLTDKVLKTQWFGYIPDNRTFTTIQDLYLIYSAVERDGKLEQLDDFMTDEFLRIQSPGTKTGADYWKWRDCLNIPKEIPARCQMVAEFCGWRE